MKRFAIIVAGGKGVRMGTELPKQFLELDGMPVVMRSIEAFARFDAGMKIFVVLPQEHFNTWGKLCIKYHFKIPHQIVPGGDTRYDSVSHAVEMVQGEGLIAVHDGVRPLVSIDLIQRCFDMAEKMGSAVPASEIVESIRQRTDHGTKSVNRNDFFTVQTPQIFNSIVLKMAYRKAQPDNYTDDASLVDSFGIAVNIIEGERRNIKITNPVDLKVAEWILSLDKK